MEDRIYPEGLCEDCFWRFECYYAVENPNEFVRSCEDDGGLSYKEDTHITEKERDRYKRNY